MKLTQLSTQSRSKVNISLRKCNSCTNNIFGVILKLEFQSVFTKRINQRNLVGGMFGIGESLEKLRTK